MNIYQIDRQGFFIKEIDLNKGHSIPDNCVTIPPPNKIGNLLPKWCGGEWQLVEFTLPKIFETIITPLETKISVLSFLNRFTDAEAIALDLASIDDPLGTIEERTLAATIRRFLSKVNAATYIDLTRQETIDGVNSLAGLGFLTIERATAIIQDTPTEEELFKG